MNPYTIIAALVIAAALWFGGDHFGHTRGINEQKVADQAEFDRINGERAQQKTEANAAYRKKQEENLALVLERDRLKTRLEKERAENRKATDDMRARYAGLGLRFAAPQGAGLGSGGRCASSPAGDATGAAAAAVIQLPDPIAEDLRRLAYDCDVLADDYRKAYDYAGKVR